jgi:hypothetical protein
MDQEDHPLSETTPFSLTHSHRSLLQGVGAGHFGTNFGNRVGENCATSWLRSRERERKEDSQCIFKSNAHKRRKLVRIS